MKVIPEAGSISLEDPELWDYPFLIMIDPRSIVLNDREAKSLHDYLLSGGFLLVDDFWGNEMLDHLRGQLSLVFPDRKPITLPHDHPIFSAVFPLDGPPQVPSEDSAQRQMNSPDPYRTWEDEITQRYPNERPQPAEFIAYVDDNERIMVLICWNTDITDGWEEEGVSQWFFENFSEKFSYPIGINILFYAMTH